MSTDDKTRYGESYTRDGLPEEVFLRVMRRADAEQNRHVNTARIADALEAATARDSVKDISVSLGRIAAALDRAFPDETDKAIEHLHLKGYTVTEPRDPDLEYGPDGLPIPPWINDESGVDYDDTTDADWKHNQPRAKPDDDGDPS